MKRCYYKPVAETFELSGVCFLLRDPSYRDLDADNADFGGFGGSFSDPNYEDITNYGR